MGTYTANKNLYMPTVGEQGWGTLMNTNLSTIDNFLKPITVSGSTYTFTGNHVGNQSGGSISATSITNSGTLTNTGTSTFTGKITANGGIGTTSLTTSSTITSTGQIVANGGVKGNLTGNVTGNTTGLLFVKGTVGTSGDVEYAKCPAISGNFRNYLNDSSALTITVGNYSISFGNPVKHTWGVYTRRSDLSGTTSPNIGSTRTMTIKLDITGTASTAYSGVLYYKLSTDSTYSTLRFESSQVSMSKTLTLTVGKTYHMYFYGYANSGYNSTVGERYTYNIPAGTTYKVKYARP